MADRLIARTKSYAGPCASYGDSAPLGHGELQSYSQTSHGKPTAIGATFKGKTIDDLPYDPPNGGLWCFDKNGDGVTDRAKECSGGYEHALSLSKSFRRNVDSPFTYLLVNWNPLGHIPTGIYDVPHFDIHFYMNANKERVAIRPGPCNVLVNCDDYKLGKKLPNPAYTPSTLADVDAVEPAMGNHLLNPNGPEFQGNAFTHTFIYGVWNTKVTFLEPMVTRKWYAGLRDGTIKAACFDMPLPQAYQRSGWYPTKYCMRYRINRKEFTTSLENFVYRHKTKKPSATAESSADAKQLDAAAHRALKLGGLCPLGSAEHKLVNG